MKKRNDGRNPVEPVKECESGGKEDATEWGMVGYIHTCAVCENEKNGDCREKRQTGRTFPLGRGESG